MFHVLSPSHFSLRLSRSFFELRKIMSMNLLYCCYLACIIYLFRFVFLNPQNLYLEMELSKVTTMVTTLSHDTYASSLEAERSSKNTTMLSFHSHEICKCSYILLYINIAYTIGDFF